MWTRADGSIATDLRIPTDFTAMPLGPPGVSNEVRGDVDLPSTSGRILKLLRLSPSNIADLTCAILCVSRGRLRRGVVQLFRDDASLRPAVRRIVVRLAGGRASPLCIMTCVVTSAAPRRLQHDRSHMRNRRTRSGFPCRWGLENAVGKTISTPGVPSFVEIGDSSAYFRIWRSARCSLRARSGPPPGDPRSTSSGGRSC